MSTRITAPAVLPAGYGSDQPDGHFPRTVRHCGGETTIPQEPSRFIAISTGNLDGAIALGVMPVASTHNNSGTFIPGYLRQALLERATDIGPALDDIVDIGLRTAPDLAHIAALHPTLIAASYRGYGGAHYDTLAALGPVVLPEGKGFNWKNDLLLLASAFGRTKRAIDLLDRYRQRAAQVAEVYRREGSPTISVARFGPSGLETHGTWSFCGSILTDIGSSRPANQTRHDNGTRIDLSGPNAVAGLAAVDADLIFYTRVGLPAADRAWQEAQRAGWDSLHGARAQVDAAPWHGQAGVLAACAVLDDIDHALRSPASRRV